MPISISVYSQQQLSNQNVTTASDLARATPSLSTDTRFGPDNSSFSIRGFTQEIRTSPSVGVFFDDVVAPRGGGAGTTSGDGAGPGDYFDLQNVQVLKGPQGTLQGRNTTGGDVLLVPNRPTDTLGGYIEQSFGNLDMERTQGVLNVPVSDSVRARVGFDRETRDGYENNVTGIGPSTFGDIDYYAFRASIDADITPELNNYTIATYSHSSNNGTIGQVFACNPAGGQNPLYGNGFLGATCAQAARTQSRDFWDVENTMPRSGIPERDMADHQHDDLGRDARPDDQEYCLIRAGPVGSAEPDLRRQFYGRADLSRNADGQSARPAGYLDQFLPAGRVQRGRPGDNVGRAAISRDRPERQAALAGRLLFRAEQPPGSERVQFRK